MTSLHMAWTMPGETMGLISKNWTIFPMAIVTFRVRVRVRVRVSNSFSLSCLL
jgi:hypothetical protein